MRTLSVDHAGALRARSAPGVTSGLPAGFILTGREASDYTAACDPRRDTHVLPADKGYDGGGLPGELADPGHLLIVPRRPKRKMPEHPDYRRYRDRNRVQRSSASSSNSAASPAARWTIRLDTRPRLRSPRTG